jgi:hypothetical protein
MRTVIGRFSAAGSDGKAYSVEIVRTHAGPARLDPGVRPPAGAAELFTANAQPVTRVRRGEYRVDATGATLTSTAPTAP